jgi:hypothetical protein
MGENASCTVLAHGLLVRNSEYREKIQMIEQAKFSFDDHASFDARSMQLEIPLNVSSTIDTVTDKLHREFEDHRVQDEENTTQIYWPFLIFLASCAAFIVSIGVWVLS